MKRELTINIASKDPINAITIAAVQLTKNSLADNRQQTTPTNVWCNSILITIHINVLVNLKLHHLTLTCF